MNISSWLDIRIEIFVVVSIFFRWFFIIMLMCTRDKKRLKSKLLYTNVYNRFCQLIFIEWFFLGEEMKRIKNHNISIKYNVEWVYIAWKNNQLLSTLRWRLNFISNISKLVEHRRFTCVYRIPFIMLSQSILVPMCISYIFFPFLQN